MRLTRTLVKLPTNEYAIVPFCTDCKKLSKRFFFSVTPSLLTHGTFEGVANIANSLRSRGIRCFEYY